MKIKNFSKAKFSYPLPDLLNLQKKSWRIFWEKIFKRLLSELSPVFDYTKEEYALWFLDYKLGEPNYEDEYEAKNNDDTYCAPLKVKIRLKNLKTKETKEQEVFLCDFPLMTKRGTFIVNGVERVVVSQLLRSPGVFFTSSTYGNKKFFGAKIIPNKGAWLEFETESTGFLGVKINKRRKAPATTLLKAFGVPSNDKLIKIFSDVDKGEIKFIQETLKRDSTKTYEEALVELYQKLRPQELVTPDVAKEFIYNMFFNFERYDLSEVGRWKFWQRLPSLKKKPEITPKDRTLTLEDVIETVKEIIRLNNDPSGRPDEIDHLGNRRVRTLAELLENRLRIGFVRLIRTIKDRMSVLDPESITPVQLINSRLIITIVNQFFSSSQFAQFMDNPNPLAELEHKRRLTATGPGGLSRQRAGFEARDVQPSHYGKICPVQTPEGHNVGLVLHLACFADIDDYGFLITPYFKVKNNKITKEIEFLSAFEEERYNIAPASIPLDDQGNILKEKVEARVKGMPAEISKKQIDFVEVSSKQPLSVSTSLIPFLKNDDAARALMGSNMQRQSVPLISPEPPLVMTGTERKVVEDCGSVLVADQDGQVVEVDASHIKIKTKKGDILNYKLKNFLMTNQYTCLHQKPIVKKGQNIKKGEILTDGPSISNGLLSLGRNVLVAFLPMRGANYEDGIIISERLVKDDIFTSITIEDYVCDVVETKLGPEIITFDIPNVSEEKLKNLDEQGIVRIGAEVGRGDILVGKISPKGRGELTTEERLLKAIFGEKAEDVKDTSLRLKEGERKKVIRVRILSRDRGHKLPAGVLKRIHIETAQLRKIKVGDKLANRHGNKGIIAKVVPVEEMPFLEDGTPVDLVLSPLGVLTRMNIGQIFETHLGLAAKKLGYYALTPALHGATGQEIKNELKLAGFDPSGQVVLYDGKTGLPFEKKITVGWMYIMKLIHMVEDKIHARAIGPYSLITQQPLGGKAQFGGQRFGEMECWALEGHGAAYTLQEMLTIKSDDVLGRAAAYQAILKGEEVKTPNIPASFNLFLNEVRALGFDIEIKQRPEKK